MMGRSSSMGVEITGFGVATPIGIGRKTFTENLKEGATQFSSLSLELEAQTFHYPIAQPEQFNLRQSLTDLDLPADLITKAKRIRNLSLGASYGLFTALEAWKEAGLDKTDIDLEKVAIVSAGSNTQQAYLHSLQERYRGKLQFMNPNYGLNFFDTDPVGALSELLGVKGEGHSVGMASASGNMAIIQGHRLISMGEYDIVLVLAPMMDLSVYEYQGFTALGAMAELKEDEDPHAICRPFDEGHRGFVHGRSAGTLVLESKTHAKKRRAESLGTVVGYGISMDANRNPNPSIEGEKKAMAKAIKLAGLSPEDIHYINTHGTASVIGDQTEVEAMLLVGLEGIKANSTKSLIGHGLTAAGLVECIASLIQMKEGFCHPNHNLVQPISRQIAWVGAESEPMEMNYSLNNSFAFGGMNTSIILKK